MYFALLYILILPFSSLSASCVFSSEYIDEDTLHISLAIPLQKNEYIYEESVHISVDHPKISLSLIEIQPKAIEQYDEIGKNTETVYKQDINITLHVTKEHDIEIPKSYIHISYQSNKQPYFKEELFYIPFVDESQSYITTPTHGNDSIPHKTIKKNTKTKSFFSCLSSIVTSTHSFWMRMLLIFLLGVLLSLTPCIYPMIPITIGILHSHAHKSLLKNFFLSLLYTLGMATTYAVFGFLAGCTGPLCGKILAQPIFIYLLIAILLYFAFSMFGFYEMYVPRFLQPQHIKFKGGSYLSPFLFGLISGTIASPCVSPGLALVLSIVATIGNSFLGFLLLFAFGVGLSTPLLIIGTFSSSLPLLPKAGSWMVEVKRLFGLMLIALCFYYLKTIVAWNIVLALMSGTSLILGFYYLWLAYKTTSPFWQKLNNAIGIIMIAASVFLTFETYQTIMDTSKHAHPLNWRTNYQSALTEARQNKKPIFIDIWAKFCSICISINNTILKDPKVVHTLESYIPLSIDGTQANNPSFVMIKNKFKIMGFPTYLIMDPNTETIIKKWGSELYSMQHEELIRKLKKYRKKI